MIVFKFGGASVKDSKGVKNLLNIVKNYSDNLIIVVSAFGKTTNALEEILRLSFDDKNACKEKFNKLKECHFQIINELFKDTENCIFDDIANEFDKLHTILFDETILLFDFKYDQVVSFGEILSTKIVNAYLNLKELSNEWIDIRKVFITDNTYREARIAMDLSKLKADVSFNFKEWHRENFFYKFFCKIFLFWGIIKKLKQKNKCSY